MNRWLFSLYFITTGVVMKVLISGFKNINVDFGIGLLITFAICTPFTLIAYYIFKKRMEYIRSNISKSEKIMFLLMPLLWVLWIVMYIEGMLKKSDEKNKIELLPLKEFVIRTMGGRPMQLDISPYINHEYECACGKFHIFNKDTQVIRELSDMKFIIECPIDGNAVTCVKANGLISFKGFSSLFGSVG